MTGRAGDSIHRIHPECDADLQRDTVMAAGGLRSGSVPLEPGLL